MHLWKNCPWTSKWFYLHRPWFTYLDVTKNQYWEHQPSSGFAIYHPTNPKRWANNPIIQNEAHDMIDAIKFALLTTNVTAWTRLGAN